MYSNINYSFRCFSSRSLHAPLHIVTSGFSNGKRVSFSVFSRRGWVLEGFHGHYKSILCNSYSRPSSKLFG